MKTCSKCGERKSVEAFARAAKNRDGRQGYCRDCMADWRKANAHRQAEYQVRYMAKPEAQERKRAYRREYRQRPDVRPKMLARHRERKRWLRENHPNALRVLAVKSEPCTDCGVEYPPSIMDLDHVRGVKRFRINLQEVVRPYVTAEVLEAELAKVEVRCPTCHRMRHHRERSVGRPLAA